MDTRNCLALALRLLMLENVMMTHTILKYYWSEVYALYT